MESLDKFRSANQANWNDRVPIHIGPGGYNTRELVEEPDWVSNVVRYDKGSLGDVSGLTLLHPQCHIGTDTLSWAKLGARVTGFDFSKPALDVARGMASKLEADAQFVECELYDAPQHIDEQFDVVYTGVGAICWLPDIRRWAQVMADFVAPGGRFYIRDGHPMMLALEERQDSQLIVRHPYFETSQPIEWSESESYVGEGEIEHATTFEWNHGLAEVIDALIQSGLHINSVREHPFLDWKMLPQMQLSEANPEHYVLPPDQRDHLPLMFSILASKPGL